uniref:Uncharacterized protein n=1 Tax=Anguilla anguilla TaxID=7936 RepID=A0A0E9SFQ0_ANGAN
MIPCTGNKNLNKIPVFVIEVLKQQWLVHSIERNTNTFTTYSCADNG